MQTANHGRAGLGSARARGAGHRRSRGAEAPRFRRNRLSEALIGALLALQAPAALASVCATGVVVNSYSGTGSGTLYNAFNNNCVELSTAVPSGGSSTMVTLDQSYTLTSGVTVYLDTAGSPMTYRLGEGSGVTLTYGFGATGDMVFDAVPVSGSQAYAEVILDPSFQVVFSANPVIINPATVVTATSNLNFAGGSTIQLSHTYYSNAYSPTLKFGEPVSIDNPVQVIGAGTIDTNGQTGLFLQEVSGSGDLTVNATLSVGLSPTSHASLLVQGAQLNLDGRLLIVASPGKYLRQSYVLVDAPASTALNGQFSSWAVQGLSTADYGFQLQYVADPQVVFSLVALHPFSGGAQNPNESQIGKVLDGQVATADSALLDRLNLLFSQDSVARALQAMDGELYSETPGWLLQGTSREWSALFERLGMGELGTLPRGEQAFASITASRGQLLGDGNALGLDQNASGLTIGNQRQLGAWTVGAALGTLDLGATRHVIGDGATTQLYRGGLFAGRDLGALRLGTVLGYSGGRVHYGSSERDARVWTWQSRLDRPIGLRNGDLLTPLLGLDLQQLRLAAARESDPLLGLVVPQQSTHTLSTLAGLRLDHAWAEGGAHGTVDISLGLRHWLRRPPSMLVLGFTGIDGVQFSNWSVSPPRNALEAGLAMHAELRKKLDLEVSYRGSYGARYRSNDLSLHLAWKF